MAIYQIPNLNGEFDDCQSSTLISKLGITALIRCQAICHSINPLSEANCAVIRTDLEQRQCQWSGIEIT